MNTDGGRNSEETIGRAERPSVVSEPRCIIEESLSLMKKSYCCGTRHIP